jgi:hypothetical protein
MNRGAVSALASLVIVACVAVAAHTSHAMRWYDGVVQWPTFHHAIGEVSGGLTDAESARFRDLYVSNGLKGRAVCGAVNAKNRLGGYAGFRRFYIPDGRHAVVQPDDFSKLQPQWISEWAAYCVDGKHAATLIE